MSAIPLHLWHIISNPIKDTNCSCWTLSFLLEAQPPVTGILPLALARWTPIFFFKPLKMLHKNLAFGYSWDLLPTSDFLSSLWISCQFPEDGVALFHDFPDAPAGLSHGLENFKVTPCLTGMRGSQTYSPHHPSWNAWDYVLLDWHLLSWEASPQGLPQWVNLSHHPWQADPNLKSSSKTKLTTSLINYCHEVFKGQGAKVSLGS